MKTAQATKDALKEQKKHLLLDFQANKDINSLLKQLCLFIDKLLVDAWNNFDLIKSQIALVAVGGYGRGELHPFSDIDLLILTSESVSPNEQNKLSEFITCLWDSGLVVGQSIRTVKQVIEDGKKDVTIATNVLEARWLSGDQKLFQDLYASIRDADFWPSYPYFIAKRDEQRLRHKKASAFDLEPNIKNCPGGLRDIQNIAWVTMRYFNASRLEQLVDFGFLETQELKELLKCRSFLWKLRFALHMISGRDENRLLFELQPQVAKLMGYKDETQLAVELMMKDYYQTVRRVMELNQVLLQLFKRGLLDNKIILESERRLLEIQAIDENFQRRGRFIEAINGKLFDDPTQLLNLFLVILNNSDISSIYASTLRNLIHCRNALTEPLINHPQCREIFMQLLRHPRSIRAFSLMHKYGILSAYFPLWRAIEGQMQFDLFHAYTVDEHTHRLLLYIEQFATEQHQKEFPLSTQLFQTLPKKGLLVLAAIFHDIGKGRGGDHSTLGATDAIQFCKLHNMNDHDGRLVAWLVQHHLLMSITAQRRDISDPEVITQFAQTVRDSQHLSYLYCLTVADICATNPNTWNSWKGSLLRELYYSSQRALSQGIEKPIDIRARVREHQAKAKKVLERQGIRETDIDNLWSKFKADYFIKHMPNQIAWHAHAILRQKNNLEPLVLLSKHTVKGGTELFIYCPDSPMLFAIVLGILDNKNINVYDATILSSKDEHALNTFIILEQDGKNVLQNNRIQNIKQSLKKAISLGNIQSLKFRPIPRKVKSFKVNTQVNFLSSNRQDATMMELIALDTPGLLAKVGDVLYRCGIKLVAAKITTIGERAEDFFMLQNFDGTPLDENQKQLLNDNLTLSLKTSFNK